MKRIFLIGYMGAGKTTLGKALARRMKRSYIDTDHFIENRFRKSIKDLFSSEGENRFRDIEHHILRELSSFEDVVISTGGGFPCFNNNMEIMNNSGLTVYLDVSVKELAARLEVNNFRRPVLQNRTGNDLIDFITKNLAKRLHYYKKSKIIFNTERMNTGADIEVLAENLETLICSYT